MTGAQGRSRTLLTVFGHADVDREAGGEARELEIVLSGAEASDSLVFVLKEGTTWYDNRGDNFEVCLHLMVLVPELAYLST